MLNPLIDSLSSLSVNDLEAKVIELQRKYFMTHNPQVQAQISNILQIYKEEIQTRRSIEYQRQKEQSDNNGLDSLIKIS